jgi:hypothetical protein
MPRSQFSSETIAALQKEKIIGIRAGRESAHKVIGVWMVVVEKRLFIRSWSMKPRSWWRTFLEDMEEYFSARRRFRSGLCKPGASA